MRTKKKKLKMNENEKKSKDEKKVINLAFTFYRVEKSLCGCR